MEKKTIGIVVGSLRRGSYCKKIASQLANSLEEQFDIKFLDIGNLTMYCEDLDAEGVTPQAWLDFRREVKALGGVLFVTPEYNRSIPPVLKNALDIASRPYGKNNWSGKPGAVVSVTPGSLGGYGANQILRQSAVFLNIYMMQQPEAYISNVANLTDETGVKDENLKEFLKNIAGAFAEWVNKLT